MNIDKIKQIINLLENSTLNSLEITENGDNLKLSKGMSEAVIVPNVKRNIDYHFDNKENLEIEQTKQTEQIEQKDDWKSINSLMVGVFYQASSPSSEPFVKLGDKVEKGQVVCIVEAMKLMNEIVATETGEIVEICVKDGEMVEYGQPLFYIK